MFNVELFNASVDFFVSVSLTLLDIYNVAKEMKNWIDLICRLNSFVKLLNWVETIKLDYISTTNLTYMEVKSIVNQLMSFVLFRSSNNS